MIFSYLFLILMGFLVLSHTYVIVRIDALRRAGLYPAKGQATMADLDRLIQAHQRPWAMRCYREIHSCSLVEAKQAIEHRAPGAPHR